MITLLEIHNLKKYFGSLKAVDGISFAIKPGETLGLVGESGCGKSTTARLILHLIAPTSGQILFEGKGTVSRKQMQIIFQDPYASLNPRMKIGTMVEEPLKIHKIVKRNERRQRASDLLELVGLNPQFVNRYPHELSGGERQRVGVARALAVNPKFIVADEPVSSLDVSIQAQILNLLVDLKHKLGITFIFIAHDLNVVRFICDRVAVMYLGKIVETADTEELYNNALHPYTQILMESTPVADPSHILIRPRIKGDIPSHISPPSGCRFRKRCFKSDIICLRQDPELREIRPGHFVACHFTA